MEGGEWVPKDFHSHCKVLPFKLDGGTLMFITFPVLFVYLKWPLVKKC